MSLNDDLARALWGNAEDPPAGKAPVLPAEGSEDLEKRAANELHRTALDLASTLRLVGEQGISAVLGETHLEKTAAAQLPSPVPLVRPGGAEANRAAELHLSRIFGVSPTGSSVGLTKTASVEADAEAARRELARRELERRKAAAKGGM